MARIEDIERRLNNWARWKLGGGSGGLGFASASLMRIEKGGYGYRELFVPTIDCEAEETDRAIASLESPLPKTVELVYMGAGSKARKATMLGITEAAVDARIWQAHRRLAAWFSDKQRLAREERRRVEALQRVGID